MVLIIIENGGRGRVCPNREGMELVSTNLGHGTRMDSLNYEFLHCAAALAASSAPGGVILVDLVQCQFHTKVCKITVISFVFMLKVVLKYLHNVCLTYQH